MHTVVIVGMSLFFYSSISFFLQIHQQQSCLLLSIIYHHYCYHYCYHHGRYYDNCSFASSRGLFSCFFVLFFYVNVFRRSNLLLFPFWHLSFSLANVSRPVPVYHVSENDIVIATLTTLSFMIEKGVLFCIYIYIYSDVFTLAKPVFSVAFIHILRREIMHWNYRCES